MIKAETGVDESIQINHPDKNKEMDIYMLRQDRHGKITENVVVDKKTENKIRRAGIISSKKIYACNKIHAKI